MKDMKKILAYAIVIIAIASMVLWINSGLFVELTGKITEGFSKKSNPYNYTYTKAICDGANYCEDYEIVCQDDILVRMTPTGKAVQMSQNWVDPRSEEVIEKTC